MSLFSVFCACFLLLISVYDTSSRWKRGKFLAACWLTTAIFSLQCIIEQLLNSQLFTSIHWQLLFCRAVVNVCEHLCPSALIRYLSGMITKVGLFTVIAIFFFYHVYYSNWELFVYTITLCRCSTVDKLCINEFVFIALEDICLPSCQLLEQWKI